MNRYMHDGGHGDSRSRIAEWAALVGDDIPDEAAIGDRDGRERSR